MEYRFSRDGHFNPLSLYRERLLREEGCVMSIYDISIHSPYTGRDLQAPSAKQTRRVFQSTLPIQGETVNVQDLIITN